MTLLNRASPALLAAAGLLAAAPHFALAQSGSALYAVGESDSRSRATSRATPKPAASAPAAKEASKPQSKPAKSTSRPVANRSGRGKGSSRSPLALDGRWHDSQCIPLNGITHSPALHVKRQYEFNDARKSWLLEAAVYTSDRCLANARLLTYRGEGSFSITGKSRVASNAYDASFKIDSWKAVPHTREGVLTLLNARCGSGDFAQGQMLDLSRSGCPILGIRSIAQSPREVELVSVSDGKFFMGTRSFAPGLSDDRPAQLSSYGLVRIP
jgi:hypothetical protein